LASQTLAFVGAMKLAMMEHFPDSQSLPSSGSAKRTMKLVRDFFRILRHGSHLEARATRGGIWLGLANGTEQLLRLLRNLILVRVLAPEAFGIMALILAMIAAFESLTDLGVKEAIIQNPGGDQRAYLNGAWWFSFVRALLLYALMYFSAPLIARCYDSPALTGLLRVAGLSPLFRGALSAKAYVSLKQLHFRRWVMINNLGGALGICTSLVLALHAQSPWALVIGFVVEAAARLVLSYCVCPFWPGFHFDREACSALFSYARGMAGIPILTFICAQCDIFVLGKLCASAELGVYSMAVTLAHAPLLFISTLIRETTMPAFSAVQAESTRINRMIFKITAALASVGIPALIFVICYGKELLTLAYGATYASASVPLALVFAKVLLNTSSMPIATAYFAMGRPELHRLFTGVRALVIAAFIFPAVKLFGLIGAAASGLIAVSTGYAFQVMRIRRLTGLDLAHYLAIFLNALGASLAVVLVWLMTRHIPTSPRLLNLVPGLMGCLLASGIALAMSRRSRDGASVFGTSFEKSL
jgi:PST family polysaccharide transporter/lipopolysaccharide exporter